MSPSRQRWNIPSTSGRLNRLRRIYMNRRTQHRSWILGIHGRAAGAALALAIMLVAAVLATGSAQAQTYTYGVLYTFTGSPDGAVSDGGLVRDAQGNLYGTTSQGGDPACTNGCGTVFKVNTTGNETVLYSFTGGADGAYPGAGLLRDAQGNLYGTTGQGGALACNAPNGCGTVFKVDTTGKETVLYSFTGGADGSTPEAGLLPDAQGNLYGTTSQGGDPACTNGCGTVFKVDTTGKETVLYSFTGLPDGASPTAGLVQDAQGNLYGTTSQGGDPACTNGCGTLFKVDTTGNETVLYSFTGTGGDGSEPYGGLVLDAQGNLYGTTSQGGDPACTNGCGTVFKVDTTGKETVLYSFTGGADGAIPYAGLVPDAQGNLYGTTSQGGDPACTNGCGTVFKVDTKGKKTVLYSFTGGADGAIPYAGLARDAPGNLYGTAQRGGNLACTGPTNGCGTVFKLTLVAPTTTTIVSSENPATFGVIVTFTATVKSTTGTPSGMVTFKDGSATLVTVMLSGGQARFSTANLAVGSHSITAVYAGSLYPSTSAVLTQKITKAATTALVVSSKNPSISKTVVTFTATVKSTTKGTPTGTVTFQDGGATLGTGTLIGGQARFSTTKLAVGSHSITVVYGGDGNFSPSTSPVLTQKVNP